jgi:hypothetical protein
MGTITKVFAYFTMGAMILSCIGMVAFLIIQIICKSEIPIKN